MKSGFCECCMEEKPYTLKKEVYKKIIRDKEYEFIVENAYCIECGARVHVDGLGDQRAKDIDEQYRRYENIVTMDEIEKIKNLYDIGSGPLSLALGFGEVTIKRYSLGVVPSKEYSDIIRKALESPTYFKSMLDKNKDKLNSTAYKKAKAASDKLCQMTDMSDTILATISYIFHQLNEVTPLALQKILYFCQGHHLLKFNKPLFTEDCLAWNHGPVYRKVYDMFKELKYHVIEEDYYVVIKNRYQSLNEQQKEVIDLVLETYGLFSGKVLENITHQQEPYTKSNHNQIIEKEEIRNYYKTYEQKYNLSTKEGIMEYIKSCV